MSRPLLLVRLAHDLLHAHQYHPVVGGVVELCRNRITGRVTRKVSALGSSPDFQPVGGA